MRKIGWGDIFRQASLDLEQISEGLLAERVIGRSGMATIKILDILNQRLTGVGCSRLYGKQDTYTHVTENVHFYLEATLRLSMQMQNNVEVGLCVIKEVTREPLNYFGLLTQLRFEPGRPTNIP